MKDLIFGHTWDAIQRAQQGGRLHEVIDTTKPASHELLSTADMALVSKYKTVEALEAAGFYGIVDRLRRAPK
jgi:hypothetical protein